MAGNMNISGTAIGSIDMATESGIMLGYNYIKGSKIFGWGMGLEWLMKRSEFGFVSIPYTLEWCSYEKYRNGQRATYFRLQAGVGFYMPSGPGAKTLFGYGAGIGLGVRKKQGFMAELTSNLYTACDRSEVDAVCVLYSAPRLSIGYSF